MKHQHKEAFCHMTYTGVSHDHRKSISVRIWNSRDGVTPFCFVSKEFGIEMVHSTDINDYYDPNYQLVSGDLFWRDYTEGEIRLHCDVLLLRYEKILQATDKHEWLAPPFNIFAEAVANPQLFIDRSIEILVNKKQPKLDIKKFENAYDF